MSVVNITNMNVLDNPTTFLNPLQFEITFECSASLTEDMEWKVLYVGSAENSSFDQILDEIVVGPVPIGTHKFILQTDAPDPSLIPEGNLLGITVILVTCSYREQEFARVGYYVNNEYKPFEGYRKEEHGEVELPLDNPIDLSKVFRTIVADKPRVTRFPIQWTGSIENTSTEGEVGESDVSHTNIYSHQDADVPMGMESDSERFQCEDYDQDAPVSIASPEKIRSNHSFQQYPVIVSPDSNWGSRSSVMVE